MYSGAGVDGMHHVAYRAQIWILLTVAQHNGLGKVGEQANVWNEELAQL